MKNLILYRVFQNDLLELKKIENITLSMNNEITLMIEKISIKMLTIFQIDLQLLKKNDISIILTKIEI